MIVFQNKGLIDLLGTSIMGVSVKEAGSFGRFGTGIKYGIATVLRGGGSVTIWRGRRAHKLTLAAKKIRGETFDIVHLDGKPLGFTSMLGRDWKPWMALREFGCNARDEGGNFFYRSSDGEPVRGEPGKTIVVIDWPEMDKAWQNRAELFIEGSPIAGNDDVCILSGVGAHLYYRGVRVHELDKPSVCRYNLLAEMHLTEDRTLLYTSTAKQHIVKALLRVTDKDLLNTVLSAGKGYFEHDLDFLQEFYPQVKPTREFLDTVIALRVAGKIGNESARKLLMKYQRTEKRAGGFGTYTRYKDDSLGLAIEVLQELGITFKENQEFVKVDELPGSAMSLIENRAIFLHEDLLRENARTVALALLGCWIDLKGLYTGDAVAKHLGPLLIDTHAKMKTFAKLVLEDDEDAIGEYVEIDPGLPEPPPPCGGAIPS